MNINFNLSFYCLFVFAILYNIHSNAQSIETRDQPNIIIFYIDDMGYAQPSCYGGNLIKTPNIDKLANSGIRFTNGYVSACICSPSRVGLLTGRYQARSGHDANSGHKPGREMDISEVTIAQRLKKLGYRTGIVGKWHVGESDTKYLPLGRGFDYYFGHGGNVNEKGGKKYMEGNKSIEFPDHPITSETYAKKSVEFIEQNNRTKTDKPFFLYLAFNAVHAPIAAKAETLEKLGYLQNENERLYAGMIQEADEAIGNVMCKLENLGIEEETIVFFISDNGGAYQLAEMAGLRGRKWYLFEGGIRVPYIIQWKGKIKPGVTSSIPVIQLDVCPTAVAAAGGEIVPDWNLDGKNILPFLMGNDDSIEREALYWRFGTQYAIRKDKWKLVKALETQTYPMLINLQEDSAEKNDLSALYPEKVKELQHMWDEWNKQMLPPRWNDDRWNRTEGVNNNQSKR